MPRALLPTRSRLRRLFRKPTVRPFSAHRVLSCTTANGGAIYGRFISTGKFFYLCTKTITQNQASTQARG